jgi:Uma2 family endonuclease
MPTTHYWTSKDLEALPQQEGTRYEIIDGELYVSTAPSFHHQYACTRLSAQLDTWSLETGLGLAVVAPGLIFAPDQDVIPDLVWLSHSRFQGALDEAGHLTRAPELVVEVLSPGPRNERRDREAKLALYSRQGVQEYWVIAPLARTIDVYRQQAGGLVPVERLSAADTLTSPLLPDFRCAVSTLFRSVEG